jgi:hypothetical protein
MVLTGYLVLSPVTGLFATVARGHRFRKLDASIGASGPHAFAVRFHAFRQGRIHVQSIPSRVRDDRDTPLPWDGTHIL